ncbi:hypothetical protein QBA54_45800 [Streptomyces sp. B21-108]|uniref:hypothetical protein n=1 Tax=Streptomyces sp. B21-108 TaxID=3039419 RepID=UPI002FF028F5
MRSARMILATAAATAAIAIGAPGVHAADGDRDHDSSSYSKEDDSSYSKGDESSSSKGDESSHGKGDESSYGDDEDSSHGKDEDSEHGKGEDSDHGKGEDSDHGKEHGKGEHESPHGGMHTGGGALALLNDNSDRGAKDPKYDPETYKDHDSDHGKDDSGKGDKEESGGWSKEHDKPSGGMHTGGGALATPSVSAAGLGILAVAGTGFYALRRKKTVGGVA